MLMFSEKRTEGTGEEDKASMLAVPTEVVIALAAAQSPGIL